MRVAGESKFPPRRKSRNIHCFSILKESSICLFCFVFICAKRIDVLLVFFSLFISLFSFFPSFFSPFMFFLCGFCLFIYSCFFSCDRYFGLSRTDRRPPNNTVNVSDLIAKPGSPSVISAPIDHSPMDKNTADSGKCKKAKERDGDSSTDTMRRPLSSTIDRVREGTGMGSRENDFLTSASSQRYSDQTSHVPVIDGSVFYGRKSDIDKDLSEQDSHRSSDASLSGGYLTMRTLNKPSRTRDDTRKTTKTGTDSTNEKENDEADAYNPPPPTRISLDDAWGGGGGGGGDRTGTESSKEKDEDSSLSINSNPSLPSNEEKVTIPLDSVWKDTEAKRAREEKERQQRESEERELREREEREWEEEKRRREEQRRQREQEAWEREQRELEELQREQELREREKHADLRPVQTEAKTDEDKKEAQEQREKESSKDLEIDPVMLQYMKMIQKKKEEEDKVLLNYVQQHSVNFFEVKCGKIPVVLEIPDFLSSSNQCSNR